MPTEQIGVAVVPGMSWWHLVAAIVVALFAYDLLWDAYDGLRAAVKRLARWWRERPPTAVEDSAPAGDGPIGVERFVAPVPAGAREAAAGFGVARWWVSTTGVVHLADCAQLRHGQPWPWPDTVDEAVELAREQELRACRRCDPFAARADTGELQAVQ